MMKRFLPHLTIVLGLMTVIFFVIDRFNEIMSFMTSELSKWVFFLLALCAIATSVLLVIEQWHDDERREAREARRLSRRPRE